MVFGQPDAWLAMLIEAMLTEARGDAELASRLRADALTQSPASAGTIDGKPFAWIADADSRLGPVLEVIINGRYYWLPFENLSEVTIEAPADLRDLVWMPAHFTLANGGESVGLIPTRYPGSEEADDAQLALARKTVWKQMDAENYHGLGQRLLTTDADDMPLMDIRSIVMSPAPVDAGAGGG
jgi:type VI secretion system protein ImpE